AAEDPEAECSALNARQPMGRLVWAADVAEAIAYLASPEAGSTTGVALHVDGGMQNLRLRRCLHQPAGAEGLQHPAPPEPAGPGQLVERAAPLAQVDLRRRQL